MASEQLEFKLGEDEDPATVSLNQDGTDAKLEQEEQVQPAAPKQETSSEDLDEYSDKVKRRIDKLTARLRETERREQAALEYAKQVQQRAAEAEKRLVQTDGARIGEAKGRIETQVMALKQIIKKAREEGDIDTETEATQRLTSITVEQERLASAEEHRQAYEQQQLAQQQAWEQQAQRLAQQQQAVQQQAAIDPRAEEWAERNEWFGADKVMTAAARAIHLDLIAEGVSPRNNQYYNELDRRMQESFPHRFTNQNSSDNMNPPRANRPVQTVAPAARSSGVNTSARRVVKLTPSQVAIAKKLGVPLEEYAKYVKD